MTTHPPIDADVVVVGAGIMGSAAAAALAAAGRDVLVLDKYEFAHEHGGSHGRARLFRPAVDDESYLLRVERARALWREVEQAIGEQLLEITGGIDHGVDERTVYRFRGLFGAHAIAHEVLDPAEAARRWPGMRFTSPVLYQPGVGQLRADRALRALTGLAIERGAVFRYSTPALRVDVLHSGDGTGDGLVRVELADESIRARQVVVTAGPWTPKLLAGSIPLPEITVTQEQPRVFRAIRDAAGWPSFVHWRNEAAPYGRAEAYGLFEQGAGVKIGLHGTGPVVDPDERDYLPASEPDQALLRYVRDWYPGLDVDDSSAISCVYDSTANDTFVIDRVGPISVAAGFCGQGFKFAPLVAQYLVLLVTGTGSTPDAYRLRAHAV